jgi:aspartate/methionine/tyrosine aminotransferase
MFSSRLPAVLRPNSLSEAVTRLTSAGVALIDLTETNPTAVGLPAPAEILSPLSDARSLRYRPSPFGLDDARGAVAAEYARRQVPVAAGRVILTASTSEAYSILFKLLCDPGDVVLVPQPSYPLLDLLAGLDAVSIAPYRLDYHGVWSIDRGHLERAMTSRTRAVVVVSPNNPTGSMLQSSDRDWLASLCATRGVAIVADEVFADYALSVRPDACSALGDERALVFALGGLSKSAGLPQVKLGWIVVSGPAALVAAALERLEVICDTYLSVSTPVQTAARQLIEDGRSIRAAIAARLCQNLERLRLGLGACPSISLIEPEGGWSAVLRVPATASEDALVMRVLEEAHVIVHPGYFFDFGAEAFVVCSLLPEPDRFDQAIARMLPILSGGRSS